MKCVMCDASLPDQAPVIKEIQIDRSDGYYWVRAARWAAFVLVTLILSTAAYHCLDKLAVIRAVEKTDIKIEYIEYDNLNRPTLKVTRP